MYNLIQNEVEELRDSFDALQDELENCRAADNSRINMEAQVNAALPLTVSELITRAEATLNIVEGFKKSTGKYLIPARLVSTLRSAMQSFARQIDSILQQFETARTSGGINTIQGDNLEVHTPNGVQFSIAATLVGVFEPADQMLESALNIQKLLSSKGFSDFSGILDGWSTAYAKIKKEREEIAEIIDDARKKQSAVREAYNRIQEADNLVQSILVAAQESNAQKDQEINNIKAKIEQIREITKDADTLRATVREYEAEFDSFDKTLESRNKNYDIARANLEKSMKFIDTSKSTIDERIQESEALLAGATTSALASRYGELHGKLEGDLANAAKAFYCSIFLMAVTCVPILDYFFHFLPTHPLGAEISSTTNNIHSEIRDFVIRAILLLPTSWLSLFNAKRYANLFKLKEHYAYKYAIASSVEGFKKQAPEYEEAIAFSAFHELSFNPANDIDGKKTVAHHPIRDFGERVICELKEGMLKKRNAPTNEAE